MFFIKFLFKSALYILLMAVLLVVCLGGIGVWLAPHYAPPMIIKYVENKTGFDMSIKKLNLSLLNGSASLKGVYLRNPSQYEDKDFAHIREVGGKVQLGTVFSSRIVIDEAIVDVANVTVVRSDSSQVNVNDFRKGFATKSSKPSAPSEPSASSVTSTDPKAPVQYTIKKLTVRLGSFSLVGVPDKTSGKQDYTINYERVFTDVTDMSVVAKQVGDDLQKYGVQVLMRALLQQVNPQDMIKNLSNLGQAGVSGVEQTVKGGVDTVKKGVKGLFEGL